MRFMFLRCLVLLPAIFPIVAIASPPPSLTVDIIDRGEMTSIPQGAQRVPLLALRFRASCASDVPVAGITLFHSGRGALSDILRVYALLGAERLSRGRGFRSQRGEVQLRFRGFTVPACGEEIVQFAADFSSDASIASEHALVLRSVEDVDTLSAAARLLGSPSGGRRIAGEFEGTVAVSVLAPNTNVRYGDRRVIARIRFTAGSTNDHLLQVVTLTNEGKARNGDLQNLFLEARRGERITGVAPAMENDRIHLRFDPPLLLKRNAQRLLELRADVRAGRRKTIELILQEPGDLEAVRAGPGRSIRAH